MNAKLVNRVISLDRLCLATPNPVEAQAATPVEQTTFSHDANGNMTSDKSRGIVSMAYNVLSLPERAVFSDGSETRWVYTSSGEKLRESHVSADGLSDRVTQYAGGMVFVDGKFDRFETPWGYVRDGSGGLQAYIRDYQGNVVGVVNTGLATRPLTQFTDYYPYGLPHGDATGAAVSRHKYGGKEYMTESGLNELDYGARHMVPQYGCFTSPDPLAGDNRSVSAWAYCNGDPVNYADPTGKQTIAVHGTWSSQKTWESQECLFLFTKLRFGNTERDFSFSWSGGNYIQMRTEGAERLINHVRDSRTRLRETEPLTLIGHSHGGNVIIEAVNKMVEMPEFADTEINIVTINTPVRPDYQLNERAVERVTHINVYDPWDPVQVNGGNHLRLLPDNPLPFKPFGEYGPAERTFKNAYNIEVLEPQDIFGDFHNSHNRVWSWSYKALYETH